MLNIARRPNGKQTFPERVHSPLPDLFLSERGHPFPYYSHLMSPPKSSILKSCVYQGWIPNQNLTGTPSPPLQLAVGPLNPARGSGGAL